MTYCLGCGEPYEVSMATTPARRAHRNHDCPRTLFSVRVLVFDVPRKHDEEETK